MREMETIIRPLQQEERGAAESLWRHCFPEDDDAFIALYFDAYFLPENAWGAFVDGILAADLFMPLRAMRWGGQVVTAANIAGVGTHSGFRQRGLSRALLLAAEDDLRGRGVRWAFLYPFSHAFYEKLGYVATHVWQEATLACGQERESCMVTVERMRPGEAAAPLSEAYESVMRAYDGYLLRDAAQWRFRIDEAALDGNEALLARRDGAPCGYMLLHGGEGVIEVDEALFGDEETGRALLQEAFARPGGARQAHLHIPLDIDAAALGPVCACRQARAQMVKPLCGDGLPRSQKTRLMLEMY